MIIKQSSNFSIEAVLDFSVEETKFLFDSIWNYEKSKKLRKWVNAVQGPTRHLNLTCTIKLKIIRNTKEECEEAFDDACHYIETVIDESAKKV